MVEVWEGAPVAVSGWVLTDRYDQAPCAANGLHRVSISVNNVSVNCAGVATVNVAAAGRWIGSWATGTAPVGDSKVQIMCAMRVILILLWCLRLPCWPTAQISNVRTW